MKERPILMSAPMVRALLARQKTQTRRLLKPQPFYDSDDGALVWKEGRVLTLDRIERNCPYGAPGDRLWIRETWFPTRFDANELQLQEFVRYAADGTFDPRRDAVGRSWKPSIYMPRWASRITLQLTAVRIERLQAISEVDAEAEGVDPRVGAGQIAKFIAPYRDLWESINGKGSWAANPWVWVLTFSHN